MFFWWFWAALVFSRLVVVTDCQQPFENPTTMSNDLSSITSLVDNATLDYDNNCKIKINPLTLPYFQQAFISAYFAIFCVAIFGNFLVIYVVMKNKRMQTITNIFITNLAVSDLMVNFTSLWLTPTYTKIGHWVFGGGLCHGLPLFQGTSIFISTWTLTAIAIDRYIVIVHNSSNININDRMSMKSCLAIIVFIWGASLLMVAPYGINMKLIHIPAPCNFYVCQEDWADQHFRSTFGLVVMTLQFIVPFVLIAISYTKIWLFLNSRHSMTERKSDIKRKKRLLRMLICMVVIFAICWFPFNLLNCLRDLKFVDFSNYFVMVFTPVHLISMTATAWNPILYALKNDTFREEFAKVVPWLFAGRPGSGPIRVITERTAMIANPFRRGNQKKATSTPTEEQPVTVVSESPSQAAPEPVRSIVYLDEPENGSSCQTLLL
ncbi:hypothetical protein L5515_017194 [Caenorhabditis briggsae]|uniref:G-protein coupled receptors family 1 profile domain-containing protein n=3 Tax=Caenorhabditis briggsae TaxID=6238 RepID=A0AAE9F7Z0_CAEBR|nr:hypothetical protein L3Y34_011331 [Caenorhabditis briggsae]UMM40646.1 hypothetical protein L5515_017194 [Caenorhabditis briggsae]